MAEALSMDRVVSTSKRSGMKLFIPVELVAEADGSIRVYLCKRQVYWSIPAGEAKAFLEGATVTTALQTLQRRSAFMMRADYYRCPNTNQIVATGVGEDKILCPCGKAKAKTDKVVGKKVTHLTKGLVTATEAEYMTQLMARAV